VAASGKHDKPCLLMLQFGFSLLFWWRFGFLFWCRRLLVYPEGFNKSGDHLSLFLEVADPRSLPPGWSRHARYLLTIVNQHSDKISKRNGNYILPLLQHN